MDQSENAGFERAKYLIGFVILAAVLLLGASAYFGASSTKGTVGNLSAVLNSTSQLPSMPAPNATQGAGQASANGTAQANGSAAAGSAGEAQAPLSRPPAKEVTIDFLYSDTCPHCLKMKPIVAALAARLPSGRLEVRYWNYADRGNATVGGVYADYSAKGYFRGSVPTFVANWDDYRVGEMPEPEFAAWVCSKFLDPKPTGC